MKLLSGLIGFGLAKSVPVGQSADQDVESLEGIFDEMEINEKLHLDLFEGDILGEFLNLILFKHLHVKKMCNILLENY